MACLKARVKNYPGVQAEGKNILFLMLPLLRNIKNIKNSTAGEDKDVFSKILLCGSDDYGRI